MFGRKQIIILVALIFGLGVLLQSSSVLSAGKAEGPGKAPTTIVPPLERKGVEKAPTVQRTGKAIKFNKASRKALKTMPADQLIEVKGREMTAGDYKAKIKKDQKQSIAKLKTMRASGTPANVEALQKDLDQKEEARINAANGKVMAEMAKLKLRTGNENGNGASEAEIKQEAARIQGRVRNGTATPQDNQRARELFQEFQGKRR